MRIAHDRLVITPLRAEEASPETEALRHRIRTLLPEIDLVDLLIEVNSWCGYLNELIHAAHRTQPRTPGHGSRLLAALVANRCNFGHATMARIAGFSPDELAWTHNWYLRNETLRAANTRIVNYQTQQPITQAWGSGTLSSSDGQQFPMTANSPQARPIRKYFTGAGATIYTWTSDRHAQYGTRIIPTTVREATYVLDAIFDNETSLTIQEHTTHTAGYTDLIFGLFDLTGLRFSPRIRDLADQRLWRLPTTPTNQPAASLLRHRINPHRFVDHWDTMLRTAATIRHGHPQRRCSSHASKPPPAKTSSPEPSKNTDASSKPYPCSDTSTTTNTADASTASSTKAKPSTPYAVNSSSPTKDKSDANAPKTKTSKENASPSSPTPSSPETPSTQAPPSNTSKKPEPP